MVDYRRGVMLLKILANSLFPVYFVWKSDKNRSILSIIYIILLAVPVLFLAYVHYKKIKYSRIFLRKIYVPSIKLFTWLQAIESILTIALYFTLSKYIWGGLHLFFSFTLFLFVFWKNSRQRVRINSFETTFKLGIIAKSIGETNGLRKGELVKIVQTGESGYVVKNSKNIEFSVDKSDISEIIDIS